MKVYITYDKGFNEIICVHQLPNIDCKICKPLRELKARNGVNKLLEIVKEVQDPEVKRYDSPAILGYVNHDATLTPEEDLVMTKRRIRRIENIISADEEDSQPDTLLYTNPRTGKLQKLFDILNTVYMVCYRNHEVGDKGEALYYCVEAENEAEAKSLAMENKDFVKHIYMKYYNSKCLSVYIPKGNYVIGKIEYYEGDPRL